MSKPHEQHGNRYGGELSKKQWPHGGDRKPLPPDNVNPLGKDKTMFGPERDPNEKSGLD